MVIFSHFWKKSGFIYSWLSQDHVNVFLVLFKILTLESGILKHFVQTFFLAYVQNLPVSLCWTSALWREPSCSVVWKWNWEKEQNVSLLLFAHSMLYTRNALTLTCCVVEEQLYWRRSPHVREWQEVSDWTLSGERRGLRVGLTVRPCSTQWKERSSQTLASQTLQSQLQLDRKQARVINIHTRVDHFQNYSHPC